MLAAVVRDMGAWGRHRVVTTWDRRLSPPPFSGDRIVALGGRDHPTSLTRLFRSCSAVLLIAPETYGTLAGLAELVAKSGTPLLGSRSTVVASAADKWSFLRRCGAVGLRVPATVKTVPARAAASARRIGYPLVVKPVMGAGSVGVCLVERPGELEAALLHVAPKGDGPLLMQRYVAGDAASVSLLVAAGEVVVLGFNEQRLKPGLPFEYLGGVAAAAHPQRVEAIDAARRAVSLFPGLSGYVGVDLVVGDGPACVMELNPRVTTAYVGLRETLDINIAEAIWRACLQRVLPSRVASAGPVAFGRTGHGWS